MYATSWRLVSDEETWSKPGENWDPKLVWVLKSFLANQKKWDNAESNPRNNKWFTNWSPRFYVVHKGELLATDTGVDGWKGNIAPLLTKLVGS